MPEPLTIIECPEHGPVAVDPRYEGGSCARILNGRPCGRMLRTVRVFREDDVRPLWESIAHRPRRSTGYALIAAAEDFPAPPDWMAGVQGEEHQASAKSRDHMQPSRPTVTTRAEAEALFQRACRLVAQDEKDGGS